MDWLEQTLLENRSAPFKFIVLGGQFLKDQTFESFAKFPADRRRILDFIQREKMGGVIFLTGDRHFTEVNRQERKGDYPLYEVTSSPLGSAVADNALKLEAVNPMRVPGTLVDSQNFCRIQIHGSKDDRAATLSSVDKTGAERWKLEITAAELQHPKP
jgi:alkaline phosphatase D